LRDSGKKLAFRTPKRQGRAVPLKLSAAVRRALALILGAIVLALAPSANAQTPTLTSGPPRIEPSPADELPPPSARGMHFIAGAATTAVFYGSALGMSYLYPEAPGAKDLRIPVAGPWIALADTGCADDDPDCGLLLVVVRAALTVIDGVGQAGGLAVMAEGLFLRTGTARQRPRSEPALRAVPLTFGKRGAGLGIAGSF
jgi:hypothetical protein